MSFIFAYISFSFIMYECTLRYAYITKGASILPSIMYKRYVSENEEKVGCKRLGEHIQQMYWLQYVKRTNC